jgi:hypothetical protein
MNWNSTDREPTREELIDVQDGQAMVKQTRSSPLLPDTHPQPFSLAELQQAGQELLARLFKRE